MEIIELSKRPDLIEKAVAYFWTCWGNESNQIFYKDCIGHSLAKEKDLPKFYLGLEGAEIIGSYALVTNDLISRQDLMPWLACLFVNEDKRGQGHAAALLNHALSQTKSKGYENLYLSTDLVDFYEKKGWTYLTQGYGVMGDAFKIYTKTYSS